MKKVVKFVDGEIIILTRSFWQSAEYNLVEKLREIGEHGDHECCIVVFVDMLDYIQITTDPFFKKKGQKIHVFRLSHSFLDWPKRTIKNDGKIMFGVNKF